MRALLLSFWLLFGSAALPPPVVHAQAERSDPAPLFTRQDAVWAGGFALGTVLLAPLDVAVAEEIQDSLLQKNPWIRNTAAGFRWLGFPGSVALSAGAYAAGRLADRPRLAEIGLHTTEAIVLGTLVTFSAKSLAGRARPYRDVRNPRDFKLGRGWNNDSYQSFPSGHTTAAFAAAAAVTAEVGQHYPEAKLLVGSTLFTGATLVGVSRMYHNVHWATDVIVGAAIGSFAGWKVVSYTDSRPDNRVDRWLLGVTLVPTDGGYISRIWVLPEF